MMRFVIAMLILVITGSFHANAGTCIQDCNEKIFVKRPKQSADSPYRYLNHENIFVRENTNIQFGRSQAIGFKKHGLTIAHSKDGFPVRTGETSFRFEVRDGDCNYNPPPGNNDCLTKRERHELFQTTHLEGEHWISYSIHVGDDFEPIQHFSGVAYDTATVLGQIYHRSKIDNAKDLTMLILFYGTKKGYEAANFIGGYDDSGLSLIIPREQFYGKWNDILIHINSVSTADGFVRIYINGESKPVFNYEGAVTRSSYTSSFKFGIYRYGLDETVVNPTQVAFYDNIFAHKQCEQVHKELKFDCDIINREEQKINAVRSPKFVACGEGLCPVKYGRNKSQILERLTCLFDGHNGANTIATAQQIAQFAEAMADWDDFRMKAGDFYWATFSPETLEAHGDEMIKTMNLLSDEAENFVCPN